MFSCEKFQMSLKKEYEIMDYEGNFNGYFLIILPKYKKYKYERSC